MQVEVIQCYLHTYYGLFYTTHNVRKILRNCLLDTFRDVVSVIILCR